MEDLDQKFINEALEVIETIPAKMEEVSGILSIELFQESDVSTFVAEPKPGPSQPPVYLPQPRQIQPPYPLRRSTRNKQKQEPLVANIGARERENQILSSDEEPGQSSVAPPLLVQNGLRQSTDDTVTLKQILSQMATNSRQNTMANEHVQQMQELLQPHLLQLQTDTGILLFGLQSALTKALREGNFSLQDTLSNLAVEVELIKSFPTSQLESWIGYSLDRQSLELADDRVKLVDTIFMMHLREAARVILHSYGLLKELKHPLMGKIRAKQRQNMMYQ